MSVFWSGVLFVAIVTAPTVYACVLHGLFRRLGDRWVVWRAKRGAR